MKPESVSVRAKIKKENYIELDNYCKTSKITISSYIRSLVEKNNPAITSIKKVGINNFRFNPIEDSFLWEINFDDGSKTEIGEDLSEDFLKSLKISIEKALISRNEYIHKRINDSVIIPTRLNRLKGRGENVKG